MCAKPQSTKTEMPLTSVLATMIHAYGKRSHMCPRTTWQTTVDELKMASTTDAEKGEERIFANVAMYSETE